MKKLLFSLIVVIFFSAGCSKNNHILFKADTVNDTIAFHVKQTWTSPDGAVSITFDTVRYDSRCPTGADCDTLSGKLYAIADFHLSKGGSTIYFTLLNPSPVANNTSIDHYKITFEDLLPHPAVGQTIHPDDYVAKLWINDFIGY